MIHDTEKITKIADGDNPNRRLTVTPLGSKNAAAVELIDSSGSSIDLGNLFLTEEYDYVGVAYNNADPSLATQETYTFKTGGSGGTTVATVVVVYTSASKEFISTVTKT